MKTLIAATAAVMLMATTATANPKTCPVKTDTNGVQIIKKGCAAFVGANGTNGQDGTNGINGQDGTDGHNGVDGADGTNGTDGSNGSDGRDGIDGTDGATGSSGADGADGDTGDAGADGVDGQDGTDGQDGDTGATGAIGQTGAQGTQGAEGATGEAGQDAVAPLGSLSFAAASSTFYGDGMGFGLSNSNYGSLEGSIVFGFDLDNDWRVVAGITTDFKGKTAGSIGVGVSF